MRATILLSVMLLCGTLTRFPGVGITAMNENDYGTLAIFLFVVFSMDVIELVRGKK